MNCDRPTPRVGFQQLKSYVGKSVIFVGRIHTIENGIVNMEGPDGSRVMVRATSQYDTQFAEVTGTVVDPNTIQEESHVSFGDQFDMNLYNEFLKLANGPHADLFLPRAF